MNYIIRRVIDLAVDEQSHQQMTDDSMQVISIDVDVSNHLVSALNGLADELKAAWNY